MWEMVLGAIIMLVGIIIGAAIVTASQRKDD